MAEVDWRSLYPFESKTLSMEGNAYHYLDEGSGRPLLMVHGNPTWSFYYRRLVSAFRDRYRAVVPDHIGCGLSDKPQQYDYSLEQHIGNLTTLIDNLDLQDITLLVHDWGGAIGLGAATRDPARFSRIVLFNTAAFPPPFIPLRIRACRIPLFGKLAVRGLNLFAGAAVSMATEKPERMTAQVKAGFLAPYDNWQNRIATHRFVIDIPTSPRHATWRELERIEEDLVKLHHLPVQMLWGMKDWCFRPSCLQRLRESFPQAEVHEFADAGHYVVEDAHEKIIPLLDEFLAREPVDGKQLPSSNMGLQSSQ
ncbi:MAG: alpha/beta hydrolase [Blastopirellula sp.]|nr:alpha/beta hydrolase [Blastopirellula sp.]